MADKAEPYGKIKLELGSVQRVDDWLDIFRRGDMNGVPLHESFLTADDNLKLRSVQYDPKTSDSCTAIYDFQVKPSMCNVYQIMAGGAATALLDRCTTCTFSPIAKKGYYEHGAASSSLNMFFLAPARANDHLIVECEVVNASKVSLLIRGTVKSVKTGKICFIAEHTMASIEHWFGKSKL